MQLFFLKAFYFIPFGIGINAYRVGLTSRRNIPQPTHILYNTLLTFMFLEPLHIYIKHRKSLTYLYTFYNSLTRITIIAALFLFCKCDCENTI